MRTKEVCDKLGVTVKALRIYEKEGFCCASRGENNYREYSSEDLIRIKSIKLLRDLGLSLKDIKKIVGPAMEKKDILYVFYMQLQALEINLSKLAEMKMLLNNNLNYLLSEDFETDHLAEILVNYSETTPEKDMLEDMTERWNFDNMAVDYVERYLNDDPDYLEGIAKSSKIIKEYNPNLEIIDVGGGTGNLWERLPQYKNITILDKSFGMILEAKKRVPRANFIINDILEVDQYDYGVYDLVVSTFTLHHIEYAQQLKAIQNMINLCKKSGTVILIDRYFKDAEKKEAYLKICETKKAFHKKNAIVSEWYIYLDEVLKFLSYTGYKVVVTNISNLICCIKIKKENKG